MPDLTTEQWLPVVGYANTHEVSDHGRVRSVTRRVPSGRGQTRIAPGRLLTIYMNDRYPKINLKVGGAQRMTYVHRLVAAAFIGPCPDGMEVCHNNGDPFDNRVNNLRYDTHLSNCADRSRDLAPRLRRNQGECFHGHAYEPGSFYISAEGRTVCRLCDRARGRRRRVARREAAA